ncbi:aspartyl-phosphate phosphatase Spo0E family protein [Alteribacillus persepolensis]|uniref:aspartyl-phosphate phosphatase Spo0E family protein n=1 Tax=Alteribacillus persepolensis TaxID=568899 RepID=UPI000B843A57
MRRCIDIKSQREEIKIIKKNNVEKIQGLLYISVQEKGFTHPKTIKLSQQLDVEINKVLNQMLEQGDCSHLLD